MTDFAPPPGEGDDLEAIYAEKIRPYWFRWEGRWWRLPHIQALDFEAQAQLFALDLAGLVDKTDASDTVTEAKDKLNALFDLFMGPEQGAEWREVTRPINMLVDLIGRWGAHSGTDAGEPPASTDSSGSTERPSKPTSTGSTASGSRGRSPVKRAPAKKAPRKAVATPPVSS